MMDSYPLVLLANEPTAYRSLLTSELPFLRPHLRVLEVQPADLEVIALTLHAAIVVSSHSFEHVRAAETAVLVLSVSGLDMFLRYRDETTVNPQLSDILSVIDRAVPSTPPASSTLYREDERCGLAGGEVST